MIRQARFAESAPHARKFEPGHGIDAGAGENAGGYGRWGVSQLFEPQHRHVPLLDAHMNHRNHNLSGELDLPGP